jgi:hypothetical protein
MNLQLSEARIRATCRELLKQKQKTSGRALCQELRARFGAVGKTTRVFQIWREETAALAAADLPDELALLKAKLKAAEAAAAEYLKRAELAEFREQAHQDHWALEVDRLRQEVAALRGPARPFPT